MLRMKISAGKIINSAVIACCLLAVSMPAMANPINLGEHFAIVLPSCLVMEALLVAFFLSGHGFRGLRLFSLWVPLTSGTFFLMSLYFEILIIHINGVEYELNPLLVFLAFLSGEIIVIIFEAWIMTVMGEKFFLTWTPVDFPMSSALKVSLYGNFLSLLADIFISVWPAEAIPGIVLGALGIELSLILCGFMWRKISSKKDEAGLNLQGGIIRARNSTAHNARGLPICHLF